MSIPHSKRYDNFNDDLNESVIVAHIVRFWNHNTRSNVNYTYLHCFGALLKILYVPLIAPLFLLLFAGDSLSVSGPIKTYKVEKHIYSHILNIKHVELPTFQAFPCALGNPTRVQHLNLFDWSADVVVKW